MIRKPVRKNFKHNYFFFFLYVFPVTKSCPTLCDMMEVLAVAMVSII